MPSIPGPTTEGSKTWSPEHLVGDDNNSSETWKKIHTHLNSNEFRSAITTAFELPPGDNFTYHATASVNLGQVDAAIHAGRANGLHAWYVKSAPASVSTSTSTSDSLPEDGGNKKQQEETDRESSTIPGFPSLRIAGYPPTNDIQAYISIFDPTKSAANSLKSLSANAKKGSLRATVAEYLSSKRYLDPSIVVPKLKVPASSPKSSGGGQQNPALDFWAYSCLALEYAGPNADTALVPASHHMLPVYMHHFGCVVPSYEALQIIKNLSTSISTSRSNNNNNNNSNNSSSSNISNSVLDMGSGNGYWTLMLRKLGVDAVAVDSGQSRWRTTWIPDTVVADGVQYLRRRSGCPDVAVLLLVYPIVGGEFTRKVIEAYAGSVIVVAGTQNGNGYTGFRDMMIDEYMAREKPDWEKVASVALPSFAGKDDALFAFRRKKRDDVDKSIK
ncbi:uncharacterized protein PV06_10306 [Exophiala oligosperma]|uniref:Uncharacterized protein n=1 Tax=Exophiala oligosperma TaxID=215243 RepID=A0A0D2BJT4_9EURO|nr:uncharacterized protein PV06_10306 [Exophiala oligosperma]KIW37667.1 hypothetical protein PV06_10306 [Exophiala oligosperma]